MRRRRGGGAGARLAGAARRAGGALRPPHRAQRGRGGTLRATRRHLRRRSQRHPDGCDGAAVRARIGSGGARRGHGPGYCDGRRRLPAGRQGPPRARSQSGSRRPDPLRRPPWARRDRGRAGRGPTHHDPGLRCGRDRRPAPVRRPRRGAGPDDARNRGGGGRRGRRPAPLRARLDAGPRRRLRCVVDPPGRRSPGGRRL